MMSTAFDKYRDNYQDQVQGAISFLKQNLDYYTEQKVRYLLDVAERWVGDRSGLSMLDFGCGAGLIDRYLVDQVRSLSGVDVSIALIEEARDRVGGAVYSHYDGTTLPYQDEEFDVVFASGVMHHVPPADRTLVMQEIQRVIKRGGVFVVFEHNPFNPLTRLAVNRCEFDKDAVLLTQAATQQLLRDSSLNIPEKRFMTFLPIRGRLFDWLNDRLGIIPFGAQYYVVGKKEGGITLPTSADP